ncbi:MAG TPA: hypothetical protein VFD32_12630 [Dehalococcoidia bacterium]|nr:hypothetical protein [Dehalococcoidia bacterium]
MTTDALNLELADELAEAEQQLLADLHAADRRLAASVALGDGRAADLQAERDQAAERLTALRAERQRRAEEAARLAAEEAERQRQARERARREAAEAFDAACRALAELVDVGELRQRVAAVLTAGQVQEAVALAAGGPYHGHDRHAAEAVFDWLAWLTSEAGIPGAARPALAARPAWLWPVGA